MSDQLDQIGDGKINDCQSSGIPEDVVQELRERSEPPEFYIDIQLELGGRFFPGPSFRFEAYPQQSSPKVSIPRDELRTVGFRFESGDQNIWCGGYRMEQGSGNEIHATLYEVR